MPGRTGGEMTDALCFGNLQFDILCRAVAALPGPGALRPIEAIAFAFSGNAGKGRQAPVRIAGPRGARPGA